MTTERPAWAPPEVDLDRPSSARVYDFFLGGAHNFAVDRELAAAVQRMTPTIADTMRANRDFLRRAVRYLVGAGVTQFLDIGSGIPTAGNVHEIAQRADSRARVVYVDVDPVAVAHSVAILEGNDRAAVLQGDMREPERILAAPETRALIDPEQPVAVLLAGVLHFLSDRDDPVGVVRRLVAPAAAGSHLLISHVTWEGQPPEVIEAQKLSGRTGTEIVLRSHAEILEQFVGLPLVEPGLVLLPLWRPDSPGEVGEHPERCGAFGGVGVKP
jgi:hypothetical protein